MVKNIKKRLIMSIMPNLRFLLPFIMLTSYDILLLTPLKINPEPLNPEHVNGYSVPYPVFGGT